MSIGNRRRFRFDPDYKPVLLTIDNPDGMALPPRKFWHFATGADNDDEPYGRGLAHWLYWPVWFKKNQMRFWLVFLEKFGQPTAAGKYPKTASEEERRKLLEAVQALHTDTGMVIPEGMEIQLVEAARSGSVDYQAFYTKMQDAITHIILSQTMTTDDGASLSQAQVHLEVRKEIVEADAHLVCSSFNRSVVTWLTEWNFPGAAVPKVQRVMDDPSRSKALAERDKVIFDMGHQPSREYIEKTYNIELSQAQPAPASIAQFAESEAHSALDQVMAALDDDTLSRLSSELVKPVLDKAHDDPDALVQDLAAIYPELNSEQLEEQLTRLLFVADTYGRLTSGDSGA